MYQGIEEKGMFLTTCGTNFTMGVELQQQHQQLNLGMGNFHSTLNCNIDQEFGHEPNVTGLSYGQLNYQELDFNPHHQLQNFHNASSLGLLASTSTTNLFYDPQLMPNMNICTTQQPTLFKDLFHHGSYGLGTSSLFNHGVVEAELPSGLYHDGSNFEFSTGDITSVAKKREAGKDIKHHASEKIRRVHFSDKFQALRSLIPNPSKNDRATIIADAIGYINELKMTVNYLKKQVVEKKERIKRQRTEDGFNIEAENDQLNKLCCNGRSSWLQKKTKNTEVDVRIIDDEVTVKLVQQKRMNCLLFISKALDELQLDLHHCSGGLIGDHYSYLFNSKICRGSTLYASAVANKVIEVLDQEEHAAI